MDQHKPFAEIMDLISKVEKLIPEYRNIPEDFVKTKGNVALCIIDEDGNVYGRMFGDNKIAMRRVYKIAWTIASQVWITGMKTGEYERLVFTNQVDESIYGIETPDLIGWPGGQPVTLRDGTRLSVGFSGFRGSSDLEIVVRAMEKM